MSRASTRTSWREQRACHLPARGPGWPAFWTRCEGNSAMPEPTTSEERVAEQRRAYAAPAARPPRREAVARAVESARNVDVERRPWRPAWRSHRMNSVAKWIAAAAALLVV